MNILRIQIYHKHKFITIVNLLQTRMYYEHEAQAQVNYDDKGIRFAAITIDVC